MDYKSIILIGQSGSGKSSIANMLIQRKIREKNLYKISDSAVGETKDYLCHSCPTYKLKVYDTIGLGESSTGTVTHEEAVIRFYEFLLDMKVKFNYICIVKRRDRLTELDESIYHIATEIFKGDTSKNFILIITNAKTKWINDENENLIKVYGNIPKIAVRFPDIDLDDEEQEETNIRIRNSSLNDLTEFLNSLNYPARESEICFFTDNELKRRAREIMLRRFIKGAVITAAAIASGVILCCIQ